KERVCGGWRGCEWQADIAPNAAARSARGGGGEAAGVCNRNGGMLGSARVGEAILALWSHGQADGAEVRGAVQEERQERRQRCGSDLRGGESTEHALRAGQDG